MLKKDTVSLSFAGFQVLLAVLFLAGTVLLFYGDRLVAFEAKIKRQHNYPDHMQMAPEFQVWMYRIVGTSLIGFAGFLCYMTFR